MDYCDGVVAPFHSNLEIRKMKKAGVFLPTYVCWNVRLYLRNHGYHLLSFAFPAKRISPANHHCLFQFVS